MTMTMAVCLNCGKTKFGAICPCMECGVSSTGNMELDIQFSDHYLALATLEQLGAVLQEIHRHCDDKELCFYTFIHFVSQSEDPLLSYTPPPEIKAKIEELLEQCTLPDVDWQPGRHDFRSGSSSPPPPDRRWWQFWRRGP